MTSRPGAPNPTHRVKPVSVSSVIPTMEDKPLIQKCYAKKNN